MINKLDADSEAIGSVLSVIVGIADQINLLALYAAVEAVRAIEQGRGFAVVADEVRTPGKRTCQSSQEIQTIIQGLQEDTAKAVSAISDVNTQIPTTSEQQATVVNEIDKSVLRSAKSSEQSTAGSDRTLKASEDLASWGDGLKSILLQLKV